MVRFSFVPGEPCRYPAQTMENENPYRPPDCSLQRRSVACDSYSDLTIRRRKEVSASRLWCVAHSAIALVCWSVGFLLAALALSPPDNPAGVGLYLIAPFIISLPFGAINALTIYSALIKYNGYDFERTRNAMVVGFFVVVIISLVWFVVIRSNTALWQYTGLLWILWSVFLPSAIIGVLTTSHRFKTRQSAG